MGLNDPPPTTHCLSRPAGKEKSKAAFVYRFRTKIKAINSWYNPFSKSCINLQPESLMTSTRRTRPMEQTTQATTTAGAAGSGNPHPAAPFGPPSPINNLTGSIPDGQPAKAPDWMKIRPKGMPKEEPKPPKLSKEMKHLLPLFKSQPIELQWTMHQNTKCMLDHYEKNCRKYETLSFPKQEH